MSFILTRTAVAFNLGRPRAADIGLLDIAHHLACINRFAGAACRPYSVAEHSLLVCDLLAAAGITSPSALLAGLMHDAHEAYMGDITTPVKRVIGGEGLGVLDYSLQRAVQERFGLRTAAVAHARDIRHADLVALATERRDLLPPSDMPWPSLDGIEPSSDDFGLDSSDSAPDWRHWRQAFLDRFAALDAERKAQREGIEPWLGEASPA